MTRTAIDPALTVFTAKLPMPPGINATYRTTRTGGFFKARPVKAWQESASVLLRGQGWGRLPAGDYRMAVSLRLKLLHRRDIDGPIKVLLDSLTAELGIDDCAITHLDVDKLEVQYRDQQGLEVEVCVWQHT